MVTCCCVLFLSEPVFVFSPRWNIAGYGRTTERLAQRTEPLPLGCTPSHPGRQHHAFSSPLPGPEPPAPEHRVGVLPVSPCPLSPALMALTLPTLAVVAIMNSLYGNWPQQEGLCVREPLQRTRLDTFSPQAGSRWRRSSFPQPAPPSQSAPCPAVPAFPEAPLATTAKLDLRRVPWEGLRDPLVFPEFFSTSPWSWGLVPSSSLQMCKEAWFFLP